MATTAADGKTLTAEHGSSGTGDRSTTQLPQTMLPNDTRSLRLGGAFWAEENARRLEACRHVEQSIAWLISGWIAKIPEWEVKIQLGKQMYRHVQHVDWLEGRICELKVAPEEIGKPGDRLLALVQAVDAAEDSVTFLTGLYRVLLAHLRSAYRYHRDATDPITDAPTVRMLKWVVDDVDEDLTWGESAVETLADTPAKRLRAVRWQAQLVEQLARGAGAGGLVSLHVNSAERVPFPTTTERLGPAARDPRLTVLPKGALPTKPEDPHLAHLHSLLTMSAHEMVVIELPARCIYEYPEMPWDFWRDMARQCWDEARHTEILQKHAEDRGGYLGQFPVSTLQWDEAYPHFDLLGRLIVMQRETEGQSLDGLDLQIKQQIERGDKLTAYLNDYVQADEVPHVSFGNKWGTFLLGGDRERLTEVSEEIWERRMKIKAEYAEAYRSQAGPDAPVIERQSKFPPVAVRPRQLAGFTEPEIARYQAIAEANPITGAPAASKGVVGPAGS